ncbi:hypothetical protein [Mucilaginibacter agri]|uniref:Uncharacterized protein n=1 Tax=Mucilaginibacter agri TaxID=2695265 RepID=A0A965ZE03_9SPHI|nr:hypothetical protein [Mucilaginibacter agri]NCD69090.1 hypothetical protein [Mucilaginibacter agri]
MPTTEPFDFRWPPSAAPFLEWSERLKSEWLSTLLSDAAEQTLRRYFNYQLGRLSALDDDPECQTSSEINGLIDFLWSQFAYYLNPNIPVAIAFRDFYIERLQWRLDQVLAKVSGSILSSDLQSCLISYLGSFLEPRGDKLTYRDLFYLEGLLTELAGILDSGFSEEAVNQVLFQRNFNQLGYLFYRQQIIRNAMPADAREKFEFLASCKIRNSAVPFLQDLSCHPSWPSLFEMLDKWLAEELAIAHLTLQQPLSTTLPVATKMPLNLSVAHLACLICVFLETHLLPDEGFASIFRFVSTNFRTKRQDKISTKSLSKEFYTIDQVSAAVVRGKLLEMVEWLNRSYFPVLLAGCATSLFL